MKHKVRLNYCINVEASSRSEAYRKAQSLIKQEPHLALRSVESSEMPSLWKMFLFGW